MDQQDSGSELLQKKAPNTAAFNQWFSAALADPKRAAQLKQDWRKLLLAELPASPQQKEHLAGVPAKDAQDLQAAIAQVVDHGGTIHIERESETGPGKLIVQPKSTPGVPSGSGGVNATPAFSFHFFHCTFDANCRNWHCGWGPG